MSCFAKNCKLFDNSQLQTSFKKNTTWTQHNKKNNSAMHKDSIKCFITVMFKVNTNLYFLLIVSQAMRGLP